MLLLIRHVMFSLHNVRNYFLCNNYNCFILCPRKHMVLSYIFPSVHIETSNILSKCKQKLNYIRVENRHNHFTVFLCDSKFRPYSKEITLRAFKYFLLWPPLSTFCMEVNCILLLLENIRKLLLIQTH